MTPYLASMCSVSKNDESVIKDDCKNILIDQLFYDMAARIKTNPATAAFMHQSRQSLSRPSISVHVGQTVNENHKMGTSEMDGYLQTLTRFLVKLRGDEYTITPDASVLEQADRLTKFFDKTSEIFSKELVDTLMKLTQRYQYLSVKKQFSSGVMESAFALQANHWGYRAPIPESERMSIDEFRERSAAAVKLIYEMEPELEPVLADEPIDIVPVEVSAKIAIGQTVAPIIKQVEDTRPVYTSTSSQMKLF
jgi:hypothetical protein